MRVMLLLLVAGKSIFHISFDISHWSSPAFITLGDQMTNDAHRFESGLVRRARRGTSALSKRYAEKLLDQRQMRNVK